MRSGMLTFLFMVWLVALLLTSSYEQLPTTDPNYIGGTLGQTRLGYAMNVKNIMFRSDGLGDSTFVGLNTQYWDNLWKMMTFSDVTFFSGWLELVRWFLLAITIGIMFSIIMGLFALIQGLVSFFSPV